MTADWQPEINFDWSPTLWKFFNDRTRVRVVLGPVGSGKTVACCANPFAIAMEQTPGTDKVRPFKLAVVRNSMPELWRTTIETWLGIYKEEHCGMIRRSTPITHTITVHELADDTTLHFQAEFFGLDRPDQVKALLSYEATMIYFNEMREVPKAIVDAAGDRIGRYPSMQKGGVMPTFAGIIGDSNPPDKEHWLYKACAMPPMGWKFFLQPAGISEVERSSTNTYRAKLGEPFVGEITADYTVTTASGKVFAANPNAENIPNLPYDLTFDPQVKQAFEEGKLNEPERAYELMRKRPDGPSLNLRRGNYYLSRVPGKDQSWIDGYYRNKFTYVLEGEPVIREFNAEIMVVDDLEVLENVPLGGGYDVGSGTLYPAGIVAQVHPLGIYLIHAEVSVDSTGLKEFGESMNFLLTNEFPEVKLEQFWGEPSGEARDGLLKKTYHDHLKSFGLPVKSHGVPSAETRTQAIKSPMTRLKAGRPGILINRRRCPKLIRGLEGAWCFRRIQVAGSERFATVPEKNQYSHVCEALGNYLVGKGEAKNLRRRTQERAIAERPTDHEYSEFGD